MAAKQAVPCPSCGTENTVNPDNTNQCKECKVWFTGSDDQVAYVNEEQPEA